jgi:hypothetical protein
MDRNQSVRAVVAALAVIAGFQIAGAQPALADAGPHASCLGLEASSINPPGTSDEFPGGMSELTPLVRDLAAQNGVSPGAIISSVAHLHEGSHAACDEATE